MIATSDGWSKAYRPLRPGSLAVQLLLLVVAEIGLYASYDVHDARFHWATYFLVALAVASLVLLVRLLVTGVPRPRLLLPAVLGFHLFAMTPDIMFRAGVPHYPWMDVFLGHVRVHEMPGGDGTWLVVALTCLGLFVGALTAWLRARHTEAAAGMPPGIGLTGMAFLRPQLDPRRATLVHDENDPAAGGPTVVLLHGLGASSAFWQPVAAGLSAAGSRTLVADVSCGTMRLLRLDASPLPAWLADPPLPTTVVIAEDDQPVPAVGLSALLGPRVEAVRIPGDAPPAAGTSRRGHPSDLAPRERTRLESVAIGTPLQYIYPRRHHEGPTNHRHGNPAGGARRRRHHACVRRDGFRARCHGPRSRARPWHGRDAPADDRWEPRHGPDAPASRRWEPRHGADAPADDRRPALSLQPAIARLSGRTDPDPERAPVSDGDTDVDVLVIGAGQAGLGTGYWLARRTDLSFLVVDGDERVGDSWRRRWDSLVLFTPRRFSSLPGAPMPRGPGEYASKDEIAAYLAGYADSQGLPVRLRTRVLALEQDGAGGFVADTTTGSIRARQVVVASGPYSTPFVPDAAGLDPSVVQLHSSAYRRPSELPGREVLVVGAGNSAAQLAVELAASCRVSVAAPGGMWFLPARVLGVSLYWWLWLSGILNGRSSSRVSRLVRARGDGIIGRDLQSLVAAGTVRMVKERVSGAQGRIVLLSGGTQVRTDAVLWCTGFRPDHGWLGVLGALDEQGRPVHDAGRSPVPGLHWVGLPWQTRLNSGIIDGVDRDARRAVRHIVAAHTGARPSDAGVQSARSGP